jgi:hypothetical protein
MRLKAFSLALLVPVLGACAAATPAYDGQFGEAVRQAAALQTLNPAAGRDGDTVAGIDGRAGRSAIETYQRSFREPPRSFDVFNIGGGVSAGASSQ